MGNKENTMYEGEAAVLFAEAMQGSKHIVGNLVVSRAIEIHSISLANQNTEPYNPMRAIELAYI